ncbi:MAG: hypothetical protein GX892_13000, partial [Thermoanaerobacteraceae bacterium]|nr:hypothetical protein [Thermoanaerobacteraceae bacterium]
EERILVRIKRILTIFLICLVILLSGNSTSILNDLLSAAQIKATSAVVLLIAMYWKRLTNRAAFWGLMTGGTLATIWHFVGHPWGIEPLWPALVSSLTIMITLSLLNKDRISKDYISFELRVAIAQEQNNKSIEN